MSKTFLCDHCGTHHPIHTLTVFRDQNLCPECLEETTLICSRCGERIWAEDNAGNDATPLCDPCYTYHYTNCSSCGRLIRNGDARYLDEDDDYPLCSHCYDREQGSHAIKDYYFKPTPIFYGDSPRYFGVELEIDGAGERNDRASRILSVANDNGSEFLYCKHDGSLEDGFELITHPMSLDFHQHEMPWNAVLNEVIHFGYQSHQIGTCGLHVHVSRKAFGNTEQEQDAAIARILFFVEKHWNELLRFSRRTPCQLERWAARYGYKDRPRDILDQAKKGGGAGRYACVNLQPEDTIEFRIFRGTLKYNTLIATLQLVDRICDCALYLSDEELHAMSWSTFVTGCQQPELVRYLKERRLYVNEPVEVSEEV